MKVNPFMASGKNGNKSSFCKMHKSQRLGKTSDKFKGPNKGDRTIKKGELSKHGYGVKDFVDEKTSST